MTNPTTDIAALIDFHVYGGGTETSPVPQSLEVRRHAWRVEAQARFDKLGLPRADR